VILNKKLTIGTTRYLNVSMWKIIINFHGFQKLLDTLLFMTMWGFWMKAIQASNGSTQAIRVVVLSCLP